MDLIREFIREVIERHLTLKENLQLADKMYFNTNKLTPKDKEVILGITGGDAYTKIISDIYYAVKTIKYLLGYGELDKKTEKIKKLYEQIKEYNKNVFPVEGFDLNNPSDVPDLITSLEYRAKILDELKKLPSVAIRNLKSDIRQARDSEGFGAYHNDINYFNSLYSLLSNRDEKLRKNIENKMFKAGSTLDDWTQFAEEKGNLLGGHKFDKKQIKKIVDQSGELDIVYDHGNTMIIEVSGPSGIKEVGCNSLWCFSYNTGSFDAMWRQWNEYSTNDIAYVIVDFSLSSDDAQFMHVLVKPLEKEYSDDEDELPLFNMQNEMDYNPIGTINGLIGIDLARKVMNFGEDLEDDDESAEAEYVDPNQLRLDLKEGVLTSKSAKGKRLFKMLMSAEFQHYDSPKDQLSRFSRGEEDRKRIASKLSKEDKKKYRTWLKTPEGKESIELFQNYASPGYKIGDENKVIGEAKLSSRKIDRFVAWLKSEYGDYMDKQGWNIFDIQGSSIVSDYDLDNGESLYQVQVVDHPEEFYDEDGNALIGISTDQEAWDRAARIGIMLDDNGVVIGFDGQSFLEDNLISEAKKSKFEKLKDNKISLTSEEREKVMSADAIWHHGKNGEPTPAIWKSRDKKTGKVSFVCHTHRAYQSRPTLKGAISIFHSFIKTTA